MNDDRPTAAPSSSSNCPRTPKELDDAIDDALADHPDNGDVMAAVVLKPTQGSDRGPRQRRDPADHRRWPEARAVGPVRQGAAQDQIRRGAVIRVARRRRTPGRSRSCPRSKAPSSRSIRADGAIQALVGGFDFNKNKFNHVTQAWRQPGSSFKPFIYSAALEKGFTPATMVNDAPLFFDAGAPAASPGSRRTTTASSKDRCRCTRALAKSKNMVSIRILQSHRHAATRRTGSRASASTPTSTRPT